VVVSEALVVWEATADEEAAEGDEPQLMDVAEVEVVHLLQLCFLRLML
jgi:hypothetical protein